VQVARVHADEVQELRREIAKLKGEEEGEGGEASSGW
jgi:hypothetical protein